MNTLTAPVRWEEYRPYGLGLETLFSQLDAYADRGTSFPPYNIRVVSDTEQVLEVALAGYKVESLKVEVEKRTLIVSAEKPQTGEENTYTHRGVAQRSFSRNWKLGENTEIGEVSFREGLLCIQVKNIVPEEDKRKALPILT